MLSFLDTSWYHPDEGEGDIAHDSSGDGHDAIARRGSPDPAGVVTAGLPQLQGMETYGH